MSYTSFNFIVFVCITSLVYFLFPVKKLQWTVLLAASYCFYLFAGFKYVIFLVLTTFSTYCTALQIDHLTCKAKDVLAEHKADWDKQQKKDYKAASKKKKQALITANILLNLGILAFLKYYNFFASGINDFLNIANIPASIPMLKLFLPLGISFYTFQSIGYVVDVYQEKIKAERNFAKVALFVSFFPQIIQGPISFYSQLAHQLYEPHTFHFTRFKYGCELILFGFFKKLVIADRAIIAINHVLDQFYDVSGTTLVFTVLLYSLQLYTDFSGGIDISRGVSQILGIDLTQNFRRPYFATTINDYWRRWHISLGAWMKEYVFYPLAISKSFINLSKKIKSTRWGATPMGIHVAKVLPTCFASLIVFILVGIWHGANWKYVAFGVWNGGVILFSTLLEPVFESITKKLHLKVTSIAFRLFQIFRTFLIVCIGYVFDIAPDLRGSFYMFRHMLSSQNITRAVSEIHLLELTIKDYILLFICTVFLFIVSFIQERNDSLTIREMIDQKPFILRYCMLLIGIVMLIIFGIYGPGFDPANFVYMQF